MFYYYYVLAINDLIYIIVVQIMLHQMAVEISQDIA